MTKNFFAVLLTSLVFLSFNGLAMAAMLGFDDITLQEEFPGSSHLWGYVPDVYGGLNWGAASYPGVNVDAGHGAFDDGVVSPEAVARLGVQTVTVSVAANTFDFVGAYFTGGWYTMSAPIEGWLDDTQIYSTSVTAVNGSPTWYEFNWTGINELVFPIIGTGNNADYVIDNFTYNHCEVVPEPASLILLGSGLAGVFTLKRKKQ